MKRIGITLMIAVACIATNLAILAPSAHAKKPHPIGADFNGDGYGDVAMASGDTVNGVANAGAVHVLYGSSNGLQLAKEQYVTAALPWVAGDPHEFDNFGDGLAHGDLNGDGFDDLVVAAGKQQVGAEVDAGGVHVLWGSANGLVSDTYFDQGSTGVPGNVGTHHFGEAVAVGDFDGDGIDDLAIGSPIDGPQWNGPKNDGTVTVLRGAANKQFGFMGYFASPGAHQDDGFGYRLAAGDFDGDGKDELAVDEPNLAVNNVDEAGTVWVMRITTTQILVEAALSHANLPGDVQEGARFGSGTLAAGRIGDDKYDELAIGSQDYSVGPALYAGQVLVVRGGPNGVDPTKVKEVIPGKAGVPGSVSEAGSFGRGVAIGDIDGDGRADLAAGDWSEVAGLVVVLRGGANNVTTNNPKLLTEQSLGLTKNVGNGFGAALALTDTNGDGTASLLIDAPEQKVNGVYAAGTVTIVPRPLTATPGNGVKVIGSATSGIAGSPEPESNFGFPVS